MKRVFSKPEKTSIYYKRFIVELENIGLNSIGIVFVISIFIGAVITIQTAYNMESPFVPRYLIGLGVRDSMLLEFSSTMVSLILAGRVGSGIASELGSMQITEQIDALEMMGVNSASYLILPKILALVISNPFLTVISVIIGVAGGFLVAVFTGITSITEYTYGIQYAFIPYYLVYGLIKSVFFGFIITSISAYHGYSVKGSALDVSKASTKAAVHSSVCILMFNLILTQSLLS